MILSFDGNVIGVLTVLDHMLSIVLPSWLWYRSVEAYDPLVSCVGRRCSIEGRAHQARVHFVDTPYLQRL